MTPFAQQVQALRRRKGWTQLRLAIEAGITKGAVGNYELGRRDPTWEVVQKLAAAFGVPFDTFASPPPKPLKTKPKPAKPKPKATSKVRPKSKVKRK